MWEVLVGDIVGHEAASHELVGDIVLVACGRKCERKCGGQEGGKCVWGILIRLPWACSGVQVHGV